MRLKLQNALGLLTIIPAVLLLACLDPFQVSHENHSAEFEFCWEVLDIYFVFHESLPDNPYQYTTPSELYESLSEPYTRYVSPADARNLRVALTTEQSGGVGIVVDSCLIGYVITRVVLNSPASRSGLFKGDTMTAIEDSSLAQRSWKNAATILSGTIGENRRLLIKRQDSIFTITVTLGTFLAPSVYSDSLDSSTAIIALTGFLHTTELPGGSAEEMDSALKQMAWASNLILDLRNNTGGYLKQCAEITAHFVPANTVLIRSHEREYDPSTNRGITIDTVWRTESGGDVSAERIFILTNEYTASASEVLVSCLKDNRQSVTTVGQTTYGKARALFVFDSTPDNGMAIVTYSIMTPLYTAPYDGVGIPPDVAVADSVDAKEVALNQIAGGTAAKRSVFTRASTFPMIPSSDARRKTLPLAIRE